jgi:hypothetical protein
MRPTTYILSGLALLVVIYIAGGQFSLWPAGIFNSAQVLSVPVAGVPAALAEEVQVVGAEVELRLRH